MNEILQKRIEEKSKELGQMFFPDNMNVFARPNWEAGYIETACKEIAKFALQNQWISVEEALPEVNKNTKLSDKCFIARKGKFGCPDWFGDGYYDKDMGWINHGNRISNIAYWMPIPSLEGGEK